MNKKQIEKRIKYLNMELAHAHYHDGWVLTGLILTYMAKNSYIIEIIIFDKKKEKYDTKYK